MQAYEFVDTWIMILKKNNRQVSVLHVYHHARFVSAPALAFQQRVLCTYIAYARVLSWLLWGWQHILPRLVGRQTPAIMPFHLFCFRALLHQWHSAVYPHLMMSCVGSAVMSFGPGGEAWFCAFLNSLIHVFMCALLHPGSHALPYAYSVTKVC